MLFGTDFNRIPCIIIHVIPPGGRIPSVGKSSGLGQSFLPNFLNKFQLVFHNHLKLELMRAQIPLPKEFELIYLPSLQSYRKFLVALIL